MPKKTAHKIICGKEEWSINSLVADFEFIEISGKGLTLKQRPVDDDFLRQSTFISKPIDSSNAGTIWCRLLVEADVPSCTQAEVTYAISDIQDTKVSDLKWSDPVEAPTDILIVGQRGRYLWLKFTLLTFGVAKDQNETPTVKNVKLCFTPPTYLEYLPAFYQEDSASKEFLTNYLSIYEAVLSNIESRIEDSPRIFDAEETPDEFLPWLSSWVGAVKDENWPQEKWRAFLKQAAKLYRKRGTKDELRELIRIYTGKHPYAIVERALLQCDNINADLETVLDDLFGGPYDFCVLLRSKQVRSETDKKVIKRIIDLEKPAHTCGRLAVLEDQIILNRHTYLGVNTRLNEPKSEMVLGKAILSINTRLPP